MKKGYLKALSVVILSSALVWSNTLCVAAEGTDADAATIAASNGTDESDNKVSGENESDTLPDTQQTTEKTTLEAPTDLSWGTNFTACWKAVGEAHGYYDLEIWRNGENVYRVGLASINGEHASWGVRNYINESGTYQFKVRAANDYDQDNTEDSEWVVSPEKTYTRPENQLNTTKGYWDESTPGLFHFPSVKGAGGYNLTIYYKPTADGDMRSIGGRETNYGGNAETADGTDLTEDFSKWIDKKGAGLYCVTIKTLSSDLTNIANSEVGEASVFYDTTRTATDINSTIKDALNESTTAESALAIVKKDISKSALKTAMQTDSETLQQVNKLEKLYTQEKKISVQAPEVSEDAASYVDAQKIAMVGAGLNAAEGSNVQLTVGIPQKQEYISDKHYKNTVQLAIELKNNNTSVHELAVPITITMPIPVGLDENKLAILHYHENGSVESVTLKNNGDGTVTFTVTDFSTFVFAEKAEAVDDSNDSDSSGSSGSSGSSDSSTSYDWNDITVNVDWAAVSSKLDSAVQAADGTNVNVLTGKDVKVSADILKKIAGKNVTLALQAGNGVALSVSGQNNKQILGALDLTVTNKDTVPAQVKNTVMAGALSSKNILITENSPLQTRVSLHVGLAKEYAGKYANLYYYDAKSGQMKLVGIYQINKDGQSMFALTHGGQYIVTVTDAAAKGVTAEGYTIVSGDTMSRIAVKMGTTLRALEAENPQIADINKIRPGQVIKIQ